MICARARACVSQNVTLLYVLFSVSIKDPKGTQQLEWDVITADITTLCVLIEGPVNIWFHS